MKESSPSPQETDAPRADMPRFLDAVGKVEQLLEAGALGFNDADPEQQALKIMDVLTTSGNLGAAAQLYDFVTATPELAGSGAAAKAREQLQQELDNPDLHPEIQAIYAGVYAEQLGLPVNQGED